jgi:hypothetical protein
MSMFVRFVLFIPIIAFFTHNVFNKGEVHDIPLTQAHNRIVSAIDSLFPHFDIWGVDIIVTRAGQEYALEVIVVFDDCFL